jgi:hypothetical protein
LVKILFEKSSKLLVKQNASLERNPTSNLSTNTAEEYGVEKRNVKAEIGTEYVSLMK